MLDLVARVRAVTLVAVAVLVAATGCASSAPKDSTSRSGDASTAARTGVVAPAHSLKKVVFHGLALAVPSGWPLNATRCGNPTRDTIVLPGPVAACGATGTGPLPAPTVVQFVENNLAGLASTLNHPQMRAVRISGRAATELTGQDKQAPNPYVIAVTVPSLAAQVEISAPRQAQARPSRPRSPS